MNRLHARYPFLTAARQAVRDSGVDLADGLPSDAVGDRAVERITTAVDDGTVGATVADPRTELLSYPAARVLVSLVDEPILTSAYVRAEAATARERFEADFSLASGLDESALQDDLGLTGAVRTDGETRYVAVATFLDATTSLDGPSWRLVHRELSDGDVTVTTPEVHAIYEQSIRDRVGDGLPFDVPTSIANAVADRVETVRSAVRPTPTTDRRPRWAAEVLADDDPAEFERFAAVVQLLAEGVSPSAIGDALGDDARRVAERLTTPDGPPEYEPPTPAAIDDR